MVTDSVLRTVYISLKLTGL